MNMKILTLEQSAKEVTFSLKILNTFLKQAILEKFWANRLITDHFSDSYSNTKVRRKMNIILAGNSVLVIS